MARQRMTGRERREQLISIGRTAFAELGFEGASVEEIAARAGVSKPVVYEHFGGKEGLYAVVVDREMLALEKVITDSLENGSWRERIEQAVMAILSYWRGWVLPRAGVAPVNYTAAQVAAIAKKAELKGFRRGRKKN